MTSAVFLILVVTSAWVGFDARSRDWSDNAFADRPWKWVAGSLLLWIVVFPMYLVKRGQAELAVAIPTAHEAITQQAFPGWTAEQVASTPRPSQASRRSFRLEGERNVARWIWVALVGVVLIFLWTRGVFDLWLYHFHLNYNDCATNGFGATFCGDELKQYEQHLLDGGLTL